MQLKKLVAALVMSAGVANVAWADKVKVEVWTMSLSPKFNGYFENLEKQYEAKNPNVDVVWVDYPWDVIQSKFTAAVAAGTPPALVNLNVPWANDYVNEGIIQPVDGIINKATYSDGAIKDVTFKGKVYAFPFYNGANVILYNTDLFKKAGLTGAPKSFAEELKYAKIIKEKTGVAGFAPAIGPTKIEGLLMQQGLDVIKDGKAAFNTPKHVAFINALADAYKSGALMKDNLFKQDNFQDSMQAYNQGKMAMLESTPTTATRIRDDAPEIYKITDVAGAPVGPTGIAAGGWMFNFAVAKNVDKKILPEVGKVAAFFTGPEAQLEFSKLAGTLPTAKKTAMDPHFQKPAADTGLVGKAVAAAARNLNVTRTIYLAGVPEADVLGKKLADAVEAAVTGKQDTKAALDEAAAFWNEKLAAAKK
jgi:putative chitobiose transport system substrate-binding protein